MVSESRSGRVIEELEVAVGPEPLTRSVEKRFENRVAITVPDRHNERLRQLMELVNADDELYALWVASNVTAMERLGMTDHGPVHVKIVMNIAVRMLRLLVERDVEPSIVKYYGLGPEDAEVVVALAALLHDVGMSIQRADHEHFSLFIAEQKLRELLPQIYDDVPTATVVRSEVLHAIIAHRSGGKPLTLEAGVVRIADALDMAKGRSRIPFEQGSMSIHSVSAAAIEAVHIEPGEEKPVRLSIAMSNSAGVFQLDQLFRDKLAGSGLEPYIELEAKLEGETEKRLLDASFRL
ncbi:MAG: HD domain-containing protein [Gemmatimonadetes bacterium]|nr:HD domain-containing protein [Gemmatimonadota bacterium]